MVVVVNRKGVFQSYHGEVRAVEGDLVLTATGWHTVTGRPGYMGLRNLIVCPD